MKNKVWENPTMTALNAKETMEDADLFKKCEYCGDGIHLGRPCKPVKS
ncbi:hypothetical protein [Clostridium sardiniense]